jgi:hypothetical protein
MPVVPIRKADSRGKGFSPAKPIEVPAADEPWVLMAAAQMDAAGRLVDTPLSREAGAADLDQALETRRGS